MYFYIHKNHKNENEQAQLLEMCSNAGFRFRNDTGLCTIILYITILLKSCGKLFPQLFSFNN